MLKKIFKNIFSFGLIFLIVFGLNFGLVKAVNVEAANAADKCAKAAETAYGIYYKCAEKAGDFSKQISCEETYNNAVKQACANYSSADTGPLRDPLAGASVEGLISKIINTILSIVGSIALVMFVYAGARWMTAVGNPEVVKKANQTMMWAGLGLLLIFSSYFILKLVIEAVKPTLTY